MQARHLDHVNLRIPADGVDAARSFCSDGLGFAIEDALYEAGEKPFLDVRLSAMAVLHLWPTDDFEPPTATNFDHVCIAVEADIDAVRAELATAGIEIEAELDAPLGATGEAPSVYVEDPFGYGIEVKTRP